MAPHCLHYHFCQRCVVQRQANIFFLLYSNSIVSTHQYTAQYTQIKTKSHHINFRYTFLSTKPSLKYTNTLYPFTGNMYTMRMSIHGTHTTRTIVISQARGSSDRSMAYTSLVNCIIEW